MFHSESQILAISDLFDRVEDAGARQAFLLFLTSFSGHEALDVGAGEHGYMTDFRVVKNSRNYFAFTANKHWLLCYFRKPGLSDGVFTQPEIMEHFPGVEETSQGEFKIRVSDYETARKVAEFVLDRLLG